MEMEMRRLLLILFSLLLHSYVGVCLIPSLAGGSLAGPSLFVLTVLRDMLLLAPAAARSCPPVVAKASDRSTLELDAERRSRAVG